MMSQQPPARLRSYLQRAWAAELLGDNGRTFTQFREWAHEQNRTGIVLEFAAGIDGWIKRAVTVDADALDGVLDSVEYDPA